MSFFYIGHRSVRLRRTFCDYCGELSVTGRRVFHVLSVTVYLTSVNNVCAHIVVISKRFLCYPQAMRLQNLTLENFRSHGKKEFSFGERDNLVIFTGDNGAGKTNIIEAMYALSCTRSFRTMRREEMIKEGANHFRIGAVVADDTGEESQAEVFFQSLPLKSRFKWNDVPMSAAGFFGKFPAVLFLPEDLSLITDAPKARRAFLDILLASVSLKYMAALSQYQKALRSRNSLLLAAKERSVSRGEFVFFEEQLVQYGTEIIEARLEGIKYFNEILSPLYDDIATGAAASKTAAQEVSGAANGENNILILSYVSTVPEIAKYKEIFDGCFKKDKTRSQTHIGPHRDDVEFIFNAKRLAAIGSRGEFRTSVLALKLAELAFVNQRRAERPVLLLDDVFSELDEAHRYGLLSKLDGLQTFITTVEPHYFKDFTGASRVERIA